ncbi:hypothetical protein Zmor_017368 [Zophobas morio]|uniref:Uncharacterized protein n=1 Tax=Zophobas morio TaxID=2755281 RepID=A0AA38I8V5_9CUCU|nr:hypothetical protein Zmor_017368 [Zophobas morio]
MGTTPSTLKIVNDTSTDIVDTSVSDLNDDHFVQTNHPRSQLRGLSIYAKRSVERLVDLRATANQCPVTITLLFKDKTKDTFRINLRCFCRSPHSFNHTTRSHKISRTVGNKKIIITIENTTEQKKNEEAEELLRKAREAMRQRLYDRSIDHLNRAKNLARQADTIKEIRCEESEVYSSFGDSMFEKGLSMERLQHLEAAQNKFSRAKSFFQRSLELVWNQEAQEKTHLSELKISGNTSVTEAMKLENEASEMVGNEEYETALDKYEAALRTYEEAKRKFEEGKTCRYALFVDSVEAVEERIEHVNVSIENTREEKQNKEVKELLREAKTVTLQQLYDVALDYLDHAKTLTGRFDTLDDIKKEESRVCSLYAETVFEEGLQCEQREHAEMTQNKFDIAESLLRRSLRLVSSRETLQKLRLVELKIGGNKGLNQAMGFENKALEMIENKQYEKALNIYLAALTTYKEVRDKYLKGARCRQEYFSNSINIVNQQIDQVEAAIDNTAKQQYNEEAKALMKKAEEAVNQRLYHLALQHLEGAEILANQPDTLNSIKTQKSQICSVYGTTLFEKGLNLEEGNAEQANKNFSEAKSLLKRGMKLVHCEETKNKLRLVELKISGNCKFNKAVKLDNEASSFQEQEQYKEALNKYHAALGKYNEAKEDYREGARHKEEYFADSVKIVDEQIERVEVAVDDIIGVQIMQGQISGLRMDNRIKEAVEGEQEEVESKLQNIFIQR